MRPKTRSLPETLIPTCNSKNISNLFERLLSSQHTRPVRGLIRREFDLEIFDRFRHIRLEVLEVGQEFSYIYQDFKIVLPP